MDDLFGQHPFEAHVEEQFHRNYFPENSVSARAGSRSECGREVTIHLAFKQDGTLDAGYDCYGCTAMEAVGSAVCTLVDGETMLTAAMIGADQIAEELGGLASKRYAAEFAADALAWSLGALLFKMDKQEAQIGNKVAIALSGGVDSAVAAHLLSQAGKEMISLTVELWRDSQNDAEKSCCSASAVRLARQMSHDMGIPHFTVDLRHQFRDQVVNPWLGLAQEGQVGNPCVSCNGDVRIDGMLDQAQKLGYGQLATGHYTMLSYDGDKGFLHANPDPRRDQSYMLARLKPHTLRRLIFPLGGMDKSKVRQIATDASIVVAQRPDSQDLCFLAGEGKINFLQRLGGIQENPGEIVNLRGEVVGDHHGIGFYTIGQRKKLQLKGGNHDRLRIIEIIPSKNQLVIGTQEEMLVESITVRGAYIHDLNIDGVRLRSHGEIIPCRIEAKLGFNREVIVHFEEPYEVPSGGQSACFMSQDMIAGQGTIKPTSLSMA